MCSKQLCYSYGQQENQDQQKSAELNKPTKLIHEFVALVQGCGEKCCLLKLGVPTGAGP